MTAIWQQESLDGEWTLLTPAGFPDEQTLHDLVAEAPNLLPLSGSPRLIVLGREVLLGSGYADLERYSERHDERRNGTCRGKHSA